VGPGCQRKSGCEGEREGAADGWGRAVSWGGMGVARGRWAAWAGRGRSAGAREREKGRRLGPDPAQPRGISFKQKFI
jgi:hypothetical protein